MSGVEDFEFFARFSPPHQVDRPQANSHEISIHETTIRRKRHNHRRPRRTSANAGVSQWRPTHHFGGQRIGEASHPGPAHQHKKKQSKKKADAPVASAHKCSVEHCQHKSCTILGHHHKPRGKTGASKRIEDGKKKAGSKPSRWTVCTIHLEARECGVDKPHGHCTCKHTAHFHDLLTAHIAEETEHDRVMVAVERQRHREREAELAETFSCFDFVVDEHVNRVAVETGQSIHEHKNRLDDEESDTESVASSQPPAVVLASPRSVTTSTPRSPLPTEEKHATVSAVNNPDFICPTLTSTSEASPAPAENKESLIQVTVDEPEHSHKPDITALSSETCEPSPVPLSSGPETKEMLIFLNARVGDENLKTWTRVKNWCKRHVPLTRTDVSTLVNAETSSIFSETLELHNTCSLEVKAMWKIQKAKGRTLETASGQMSLLRQLLPACMKVDVYTGILKIASSDASLNKQAVFQKDQKISRSLGPIVRNFVYTTAAKLSKDLPESKQYNDSTLLLYTAIAIMNQLTSKAIVTLLAANGEGVDFCTRGRSITQRSKGPRTV